MNDFCLGLGLVISPTKTEVVVFNGPGTPSLWHVGSQTRPQSPSFKYLVLVFHASGSLSPALRRLARNAVGARAQLQTKLKRLMCDKSVPMLRRLFDAIMLPTVSYGAEIWGTFCSHPLPTDVKQMADVQLSFLRQLFHLNKSVTPAIIFRELAEKPWVHRWWSQDLGFMHRFSLMPQSSIHVDILKDNHFAAQQHPRCGNWAAGVMKQYAGLGMPSPFSSSGITALNSLGFQANMEGQHRKVWDGLHVSPRLAPSKGAKSCTYFAWFFRPSQLRFEPYLDIPMSISRLRLLMHFWKGSHSLPV